MNVTRAALNGNLEVAHVPELDTEIRIGPTGKTLLPLTAVKPQLS